jgi:hypothetical protein
MTDLPFFAKSLPLRIRSTSPQLSSKIIINFLGERNRPK